MLEEWAKVSRQKVVAKERGTRLVMEQSRATHRLTGFVSSSSSSSGFDSGATDDDSPPAMEAYGVDNL